MNERITFKKKPRKLYKCQHFFGFQLARAAPVLLEAGGKPSTWFPPEGLVELTCHARGMQMSSDGFLMEKLKFSKNSKNLIFLKFYENLSVTQTLCLQTQIDK